ncbi:hypothetical protein Tco_0959908 [Tanacetum coccineum]
MVLATAPLIGFSREIIWPMGQISLPVKIGDAKHLTSTWMNFVVFQEEYSHCEAARLSHFNARWSQDQKHSHSLSPELQRKESKRNLDIFAWKPVDMTGVPRHIAEHRLNVLKGCPPVRQKKRSQAPKRNKEIQEKLEKLVDAGIMKEVHYHIWLSNLVMVKKHDNSWRMCVDFKDLNKACPKDGYPLLEIDWKDKVESVLGLPSSKCLKDIQRLNGKLESLNRFLAKSAEKSLPFFKTLKKCTKNSDFQWMAEAEAAFKQIKKLIAELPTLTATYGKGGTYCLPCGSKRSRERSFDNRKGGEANANLFR